MFNDDRLWYLFSLCIISDMMSHHQHMHGRPSTPGSCSSIVKSLVIDFPQVVVETLLRRINMKQSQYTQLHTFNLWILKQWTSKQGFLLHRIFSCWIFHMLLVHTSTTCIMKMTRILKGGSLPFSSTQQAFHASSVWRAHINHFVVKTSCCFQQMSSSWIHTSHGSPLSPW